MINLAFEHGIIEKDEDKVRNRITVKEERLKKFSSIYQDHEKSDYYKWSIDNFGSPNGA